MLNSIDIFNEKKVFTFVSLIWKVAVTLKSTFQGDIIKLKLSEDLDFSTLEDKRKASGGDSPGGSHGGISASPKSLNSRRKGRKLTSGDNTEPPTDELDQVGFMDDPDLNLLFETSGKLIKDFFYNAILKYERIIIFSYHFISMR